MCTLSNLHPNAPTEEKSKFVFSLFDTKDDHKIDIHEIRLMMAPLFEDVGLKLTDAQIEDLLMGTFDLAGIPCILC